MIHTCHVLSHGAGHAPVSYTRPRRLQEVQQAVWHGDQGHKHHQEAGCARCNTHRAHRPAPRQVRQCPVTSIMCCSSSAVREARPAPFSASTSCVTFYNGWLPCAGCMPWVSSPRRRVWCRRACSSCISVDGCLPNQDTDQLNANICLRRANLLDSASIFIRRWRSCQQPPSVGGGLRW